MPSTRKELRDIEKRARKADQERSSEHATRRESRKLDSKRPRGAIEIREALIHNKPRVRVFKSALFETFIEQCKLKDLSPPAYRLYEKQEEADARFMFDIQTCMARLNWLQLSRIVDAGVGVPIPISSITEAFHHALRLMVYAFDVARYLESPFDNEAYLRGEGGLDTSVEIQDRDALEEWPISARKRKSDRKEEISMFADENNRKLRASAGDDEDDEDDEPKGKGGSDDDEDDEDEAPKRKSKAKASSKRRASKDEDEDDEPPRRKKRASKDDDDDEDEDEKPARKRKPSKDEDDDEDEKPARKKRASSKDDDDDEPKKSSKAKVVLKDTTVVAKIAERDKGGPKSKVLALISKKGMTIKELMIDAKEEGIATSKVKGIVEFLMKYNYVKVKQ